MTSASARLEPLPQEKWMSPSFSSATTTSKCTQTTPKLLQQHTSTANNFNALKIWKFLSERAFLPTLMSGLRSMKKSTSTCQWDRRLKSAWFSSSWTMKKMCSRAWLIGICFPPRLCNYRLNSLLRERLWWDKCSIIQIRLEFMLKELQSMSFLFATKHLMIKCSP